MRNAFGFLLLSAAVLLLGPFVGGQESSGSFAVRGDILNPRQWTVSEIRQQFAAEIQTIRFTTGTDKEQHTGTGVPLISLLQAAAPRTEKAPKHYDLTFLVILEGRDGYRVFFSLAELLPACGHAQAWIVMDMDGKPLPDSEAPVRLAILSDQGHDRYLYGIASVTLVDGTKLAAQLPTRR